MRILKLMLLLLGLIIATTFAAKAQKAYDEVVYGGKSKLFSLKLTLADGYIEASELQATNLKSNKKTRYVLNLDDSDEVLKMSFSRQPTNGTTPKSDYFVWDWAAVGDIPNTMTLIYYLNGKVERIVLRRK